MGTVRGHLWTDSPAAASRRLRAEAAGGMNWNAYLERKHSLGVTDLSHEASLSRPHGRLGAPQP